MSPAPVPASVPAPRLWLVRHAVPGVAPGTCYGALDVAADALATHAAATRLAAALPAASVVCCSPLLRCEQLAQALLALRPDLSSKTDPRLREMDFGRWEGQRWDHIAKRDIDTWTAAFASHAPGGGESLAAMLARVSVALQSARQCADQATAQNATTEVVWITHAGVMRCVHWLQTHGHQVHPRSDEWPQAAPGWGEWEIRILA